MLHVTQYDVAFTYLLIFHLHRYSFTSPFNLFQLSGWYKFTTDIGYKLYKVGIKAKYFDSSSTLFHLHRDSIELLFCFCFFSFLFSCLRLFKDNKTFRFTSLLLVVDWIVNFHVARRKSEENLHQFSTEISDKDLNEVGNLLTPRVSSMQYFIIFKAGKCIFNPNSWHSCQTFARFRVFNLKV